MANSLKFGFAQYVETIRGQVTTMPVRTVNTGAQERALLPSVGTALEGTRVSHMSMNLRGNTNHHVSPQAQDGELLQRTTDVSNSHLHPTVSVTNEMSLNLRKPIDDIPQPIDSWEVGVHKCKQMSKATNQKGINIMIAWVEYYMDSNDLQTAKTKFDLINSTLVNEHINLGSYKTKELKKLGASLNRQIASQEASGQTNI